MIVPATPAEIARARALRQEGEKLKDIAQIVGRHHSVIQRWCMDIVPGVKEAKIEWEPFDGVWRIYVCDKDREPVVSRHKKWWALEWVRGFKHYHVAQEHLERYGEKWGVAA